MRQRKPDSYADFMAQFWGYLIFLPVAISFWAGFALSDPATPTWGKFALWFLIGGLIILLCWVGFVLDKAGFLQALYAHYLKRWEEKEKQEAAKLYLGRKEE